MANENNVASIDVAQESADGHRAIPRRGRDGLPGRTATPTLRNHDQGAAPFIGLAAGARGNRSGHGVHSAILEAGVEGVGTVPAFIPGASLFQPCSQGAEAGLPRRRAVAAAVPGGGVDLELCPGARAAELAHHDPDEDPLGAMRVITNSVCGLTLFLCPLIAAAQSVSGPKISDFVLYAERSMNMGDRSHAEGGTSVSAQRWPRRERTRHSCA